MTFETSVEPWSPLDVARASFRSTSSMEPQVDLPTIIPHEHQKPAKEPNRTPLYYQRRHYSTARRRNKKSEPKKPNLRNLLFLGRKSKSKAKTAPCVSVPKPNFNQFHSEAAKQLMNDEHGEYYNPLEESFYSVKRVSIPHSHFAATGEWVFPKHQPAGSDVDSIADISTESTRGIESVNDEDHRHYTINDSLFRSHKESLSSLLELSSISSKTETKGRILDKDHYQEIENGEKDAEAYFENLGCHLSEEEGGDLVREYYRSLFSKTSAADCVQTSENICNEGEGRLFFSQCYYDDSPSKEIKIQKEEIAATSIKCGNRRGKRHVTFSSCTPSNIMDGDDTKETKLIGPFFDDENKVQANPLGVSICPQVPPVREGGKQTLQRGLTDSATIAEGVEGQVQQLLDYNDSGSSERAAEIAGDRLDLLSKSFSIQELLSEAISKEARQDTCENDLCVSSSSSADIRDSNGIRSLSNVPSNRADKIRQVLHKSNVNYQTGLNHMSEKNLWKAKQSLEKALRARVMIWGPHHFEVAIVHSKLGDLGGLFHEYEGTDSDSATNAGNMTFHYSAALTSLQKEARTEVCTGKEYPRDKGCEDDNRRIELMQHVQDRLHSIGHSDEE